MPAYIAARDLAGLPIGTHQFIIIELKSKFYPAVSLNGIAVQPKKLGNGKVGFVVGAHNRANLAVKYFEKNDYQAALEYFDKNRVSFFKSDFDTEVIEVKFRKLGEENAIRKVLNLIEAYSTNQSYDTIKYPPAGFGFNSNSWAQTVIELAGSKIQSDMRGIDISHEKRIPKTYFDSICPTTARAKIN